MNRLNLVLGFAVVVLALGVAWKVLEDGGTSQLGRTPDLLEYLVIDSDADKDWTAVFLDIIKAHEGEIVEDSESAWKAAGKAFDGAQWEDVARAWVTAETILSGETRSEQRQQRATAGIMHMAVKKAMSSAAPLRSCLFVTTLLTRHGLFEEADEVLIVIKAKVSKVSADILWSETVAEAFGHTASYDLDWRPKKSLEASCSVPDSSLAFCRYLHEEKAWEAEFHTRVLLEGTGEVYGPSAKFLASVKEWQSKGIAVDVLPSRLQQYVDRDTLLIQAKAPVTMSMQTMNDIVVNNKRFVIDWQIPPQATRFQPNTKALVVERPVVYVTTHFFNYHHALVSIMTRLVALMESGILETIPELGILMQPPQDSFLFALLELLPMEVSDRFVFLSDTPQTFKDFFVVIWPDLEDPNGHIAPYSMQHYRMPPPSAISLLRERLLPPALKSVTRDTVVVYSRENFTVRHTSRDEELAGYIQASLDDTYGVGTLRTVLFPLPKMDIAAQQDLFARAIVVVGPHGAGLTNALWSQPGTVVIERPTVSTFQAAIFSHLSLSGGLEHAHLRKRGVHIAQNRELGTHHRGSYPVAHQLITDAVTVAVGHVMSS